MFQTLSPADTGLGRRMCGLLCEELCSLVAFLLHFLTSKENDVCYNWLLSLYQSRRVGCVCITRPRDIQLWGTLLMDNICLGLRERCVWFDWGQLHH